MANIFTSSIGKKLIMSISGLFLIVFLLLHLSINALSLISEEAFKAGCDFMALPFVTVMVPILAGGFVVHIAYAGLLSLQNMKSRGSARYAVSNKAKTASWAAKNMLALGIIVLGGIGFHLTHFWAEMQLLQFQGVPHSELANPNLLMEETFSKAWILALYLIWFAAIWFHLCHGFWSAFQSIGLNNGVWMKRWKFIAVALSTIICLGFAVIALAAFIKYSPLIN